MTKDEIIKKIRKKGYWEVNIHPAVYNANLLPKEKTEVLIKDSVVELRGWDYPHIGTNSRMMSGVESITDWEHYVEFWKMTTSGNFYHTFAIREDWIEYGADRNMWSNENLSGKKLLGAFSTLYTLTEIYEFARRLVTQMNLSNNVVIDIKLFDLKDRRLHIDSYNRTPFFSPRIATTVEPWSNDKKEISLSDILEKSSELALNDYLSLIYLFEWDNPPIDNLRDTQKKFLEGRI